MGMSLLSGLLQNTPHKLYAKRILYSGSYLPSSDGDILLGICIARNIILVRWALVQPQQSRCVLFNDTSENGFSKQETAQYFASVWSVPVTCLDPLQSLRNASLAHISKTVVPCSK